MKLWLIIGLTLVIVSSAFAASAKNWSAVPLAQWTEARTVDSCTEAIPPDGLPAVIPADQRMPLPVPEPPFGTWKEQDGQLVATGLANCWSTMLTPGDQHDTSITTRFTVQKSSNAARQLPGGCVRWGFHWGENLPGWDVGVVLGYQDPLNFYRVQLSAARGELALWDATGGFLQLIPCKIAMNQPHDLKIGWHGAHIDVVLDNKPVMNYWDRSLPYTHGQVGLTVWKSETQFAAFSVEQPGKGVSSVRMPAMPAHKPNFRFEPTQNILTEHPGFHMTPRSGLILFDGNEPISYFYKQELDKGTPMLRGSLVQEAVKLKPGWRAAYDNFIGPPGNDGNFPVLQDELPAALHITSQGTVLTFNYQTLWNKALRTDYTCTVRYDDKRGVYRYEYKGAAHCVATANFNEFEFYDPYVYNNRVPGPEVTHTWNPTGHRWWVYQAPGGNWERFAMIDPLGHDESEGQWGKCSDFLYPDPAACPYFENQIDWAQPKGRLYHLGQCNWGYDYHHREVGARLTMNPGDERTFAFTFTALPPAEAEALYAQSKLAAPVAADKAVLTPFIANGNTFAQTDTWQDPHAQMYWEGGTRDETVGHGDHYSLRIDGPGKTGVLINQYILEAYAKRWWVRGWIKTKGVSDPGVKLTIAYPGVAKDIFNLGKGDQEWTYFSFTTSVFLVRDATQMHFEVPGGTAWIDDIAVSALADDQHPPTTGTAVAK